MSHFGGAYTKIGTIQRRLAWPLRKDDTQIREAFQLFNNYCHFTIAPDFIVFRKTASVLTFFSYNWIIPKNPEVDGSKPTMTIVVKLWEKF